ncbi:RluA family pseudouridine synthase [Anaerovorax odorimutans]|uniref:Pseudouridine synthase n=1 Tax=Anaerovorax odorimutans TaxID=109327 RepID=A0ABT1RPK3_9FIRM|nr:RluA family pseudouridine synthase [Anaerovorax odorimutans]MCQ4637124.1 RluA family pseudouridine synthase [Anaerovorax odorimutans]
MVKLTITKNESSQRLDRFLKKYLKNAPLSHIYKLIRKDVKVNGKRAGIDTVLEEGDELSLYVSQEKLDEYLKPKKMPAAKRQFGIAYEDENLIIVEKPFGLLTHGDAAEKKNTLANQVCGYLQQKGEYNPGRERTFVPSPVNRLDRNTTGLVLFGKTSDALQLLNKMIRERGRISKQYLTIVAGKLDKPLTLADRMEKDEARNLVKVLPEDAEEGKLMQTIARPLRTKGGFTLVEVELITGRTHQIRAHLSQAGFPIIGDVKYGNRRTNETVKKRFGLTTQLLHAEKLVFRKSEPPLAYLEGKVVRAQLPPSFERIKKELFD